MPASALEQKFAKLVLDFCAADRSGLPPATAAKPENALPFRTAFQTGDRPKPCVVFHCEQVEEKTNKQLIDLVVEVATIVNHKNTTTTEAVQSIWTKLLRDRLKNPAAWRAWLPTLSEADRTGFRILKYRLKRGSNSFDKEEEQRDSATFVHFTIITDELHSST